MAVKDAQNTTLFLLNYFPGLLKWTLKQEHKSNPFKNEDLYVLPMLSLRAL